jgi:hypothetical protein
MGASNAGSLRMELFFRYPAMVLIVLRSFLTPAAIDVVFDSSFSAS